MSSDDQKLKVFISYSRRDLVFADRLVEALEEFGFSVLIDRRDLPYGEEWQKELGDLIRDSDTVVWLVSPDSITSDWCNWELGFVGVLKKRLIPIKIRDIDIADIPKAIGKIHLMPAEGLFSMEQHLAALAETLNSDRGWLKEATRISDRARQWLAKERDPGLLLRGAALRDAEEWEKNQPSKSPVPSGEVLELILASRQTAMRRQNYWIGGSLTAAVIAIALAGFGFWQSNLADQRRLETVELRKLTQRTESGLLSQSAAALRNDPVKAMLLALEGMPDKKAGISRPLVAETRLQLDKATRSIKEQRVLPHEGNVNDVAFAPDGRLVATASSDKSARLFEVATGKQIAHLPHEAQVLSVKFSPETKYLVTGSLNGSVRLFEVATKKEILRFDHPPRINKLLFSPDGKLLVSASGARRLDGGGVRIFDVGTGKEVFQFLNEVEVRDIAFSPDGRIIASAHKDPTGWRGSVQFFDLSKGQEVQKLEHNDVVNSIAFGPDGRLLASVTGEPDSALGGDLRLFDVVTGKERWGVRFDRAVIDVSFSKDGRKLSVGSYDKSARVFDVGSGKEDYQVAHSFEVSAAEFSNDGKFWATASANLFLPPHGIGAKGGARLFDARTGRELAKLVLNSNVNAVEFSPDNRVLATAADDMTARLFEATVGQEDHRLGHNGRVWAVDFSLDGRLVATASLDGTTRLFDSGSGAELRRFTHNAKVRSVSFSPDGRYLAAGSGDPFTRGGDARLFEVATGIERHRIAHDGGVWGVVFSPDGKFLLTSSGAPHGSKHQGQIRLFSVETGLEKYRIDQDEVIEAIAFGPKGKFIGSGSQDGSARLFDSVTGRLIHEFPHEGPVFDVEFSADDKLVVTGSRDGTARVFDTATGNEKRRFRIEQSVWVVAISPDAKLIAIGSHKDSQSKGEARIFEIHTANELWKIPHDDPVFDIAFSSTGQLLATASGDNIGNTSGTIRLFSPVERNELARLPYEGVVKTISFSSDESKIVGGSYDATARLWRVFKTSQELVDFAKSQASRCLTHGERIHYFLPVEPPAWCAKLGKWPYDPRGAIAIGKKHLAEGRDELATMVFSTAFGTVEAFPPEVETSWIEAYLARGRNRLKEGRDEEAAEHFSSAQSLGVKAEAVQAIYYDLANSLYFEFRNERNAENRRDKLVRAQTLLNRSLKQYQTTNDRSDLISRQIFLLGQLYFYLEQYPEAIEEFQRAKELGHKDAKRGEWFAVNSFGSRQLSKGQEQDGLLTIWTNLLNTTPEDRASVPMLLPHAPYAIAAVHGPISAVTQSAKSHLCDELATHSNDPLRAFKPIEFEEIKLPDAIQQCEKAIGERPNEPRYLFLLGRTYSRKGRVAADHGGIENAKVAHLKAVEYFNAAAERGYPAAFNSLALAYRNGEGVTKNEEKVSKFLLKRHNSYIACCWATVARELLANEVKHGKDRVRLVVSQLTPWAAALGSRDAAQLLEELRQKGVLEAVPNLRAAALTDLPPWLQAE